MGHTSHTARLVSALVAAVVLLSASVARAEDPPERVDRDRTDNTLTITYDSDSGSIDEAVSSRRLEEGDRVAFLVDVRSDEDAEVGERLVGRLRLELVASKPLRYNGRFRLVLRDDAGAVVQRLQVWDNIVLRPRRGGRTAVLVFRFDLENSGTYDVWGTFVARQES